MLGISRKLLRCARAQVNSMSLMVLHYKTFRPRTFISAYSTNGQSSPKLEGGAQILPCDREPLPHLLTKEDVAKSWYNVPPNLIPEGYSNEIELFFGLPKPYKGIMSFDPEVRYPSCYLIFQAGDGYYYEWNEDREGYLYRFSSFPPGTPVEEFLKNFPDLSWEGRKHAPLEHVDYLPDVDSAHKQIYYWSRTVYRGGFSAASENTPPIKLPQISLRTELFISQRSNRITPPCLVC